jgi:Cu/Zn superoxide dismutase
MQRRIMMPLAVLTAALMTMLSVVPAVAIHEDDTTIHPFADADFWETWARTDKPVADGDVARTWIWGDERSPYTEGMMEEYEDSPGGERLVQYFDKSRMEINDPNAQDDDLWYVTNGLLVVEMVEGHYQTGDAAFDESPDPAEVNVTGDPGDESGLSPTYADINDFGLRDAPALAEGTTITQTIDADGNIGDDPSKASEGVTAAERVQVPTIDHTVASVFWTFMTSQGEVWIQDDAAEDTMNEEGELVTEPLFVNEFYATGYPITEAYWSEVMVNEQLRWVLWQCFERRCLTYTPGNPAGFLVEAGNVGQHYYRWRYGEAPPVEELDVTLDTLNDSGVTGTAHLRLEGSELTVEVEATGLEPDQEHAMHIHGKGPGEEVTALQQQENATCPPAEADEDGDGIISLDEGIPYYGEVQLPLGEPTAASDGSLSFEQTFPLTAEQMTALGDLTMDALVVHGMTTSFDQDGDGTTDEYEPLLPVACGEIGGAALEYEVNFGSLNGSGVMGTGQLSLAGDQLTVTIEATGLEADQMHMMHIHGNGDGSDATCPPPSADEDGDGIISLEEGEPFYGPVQLGLGEPMVGADGVLSFEETFPLTADQLTALGDLTNDVIVIHGLTTPFDQDGDTNTDEYEPLLPVACGEVSEPGSLDDAETYTATVGTLNESGVTGTAEFTLDGNLLLVSVEATGLEGEQMHPMHIHGHDDGTPDATCPTLDQDANQDGIISLEEGLPAYGAVLVALGMPLVGADGVLSYDAAFIVDGAALGDLSTRAFVIHGLTTEFDQDGDEIVDEYEPFLPVGCGTIETAS